MVATDKRDGSTRAHPCVLFDTELGPIIAELFAQRAPLTVGNFLRHVDEGRYEKATFYRAVRPHSGARSAIRIIQGGLGPQFEYTPALPPIPHESTGLTGLSHFDGALSMARLQPGTAASEFFVVIGNTPALDFGGLPASDGEGYAVFGLVVEGMDVVRRIHAGVIGTVGAIAFMTDQSLVPPVRMRILRYPASGR